MPGYAANLVRSGARGLTTRRRSYAAATLSTILRSTPANEAPAGARSVAAAPTPTPTPAADHAPILGPSQPSITHALRVETRREAPHSSLEVSSASPPAQTSRAPEERAPAFSAAAMPPEPFT